MSTMSFESQILAELKGCGVRWVCWLPDSETKTMYNEFVDSPDIRMVQVCREDEAVGVCAGLLTGGERAAVMIQNTGVMNAVDAIRGLALYYHLPMLLLVGYREYQEMISETPPVASVALYTEPLLEALKIPYFLIRSGEEVDRIGQAYEEAQRVSGPAAALIVRQGE